jgi:hypothetical protein
LMRVAVLASGFLHGAPESAKNFRACLLEPLDADVYVFTSHENVTREAGGSKHASRLTDSDLNDLYAAWFPHVKAFGFTEENPNYSGELSLVLSEYDAQLQENFRPKTPPEYVDLPYRMSCIDQYLRLAYCWDQIYDEPYDVFIRARPDLVFEKPLEIGEVDEGVLYVPCKQSFYDEYHSRNYLKEFLFWGSREVMEQICSQWVYAYGIHEPLFDCNGSDYTLCPEHQFYLYAKSLKLQVEFVPLTCRYSEAHRAYEVVKAEDCPGENRVRL